MRSLLAPELLRVWEQGFIQPLLQCGLTLLAAACPETSLDALAKLSIGQRDALLLRLREQTFGPQLTSLVICSNCGERLELNFKVADILVEPEIEAAETYSLNVADYEASFRLPNSLDLAALSKHTPPAAARQQLLQRCLVVYYGQDQTKSLDQVPAEVIEAVTQKMSQADPQAKVRLSLLCPACEHQWLAVFDILSFFWTEINSWAHRILREAHTLASAYGWSETDILTMSPWRRRFYLDMLK